MLQLIENNEELAQDAQIIIPLYVDRVVQYVCFLHDMKELYDRRGDMFKSRILQNLVRTWLLPIFCAALGLSVIAVVWLLPQVKEEGVWHEVSAQIEEKIIQENATESASVEGEGASTVEAAKSEEQPTNQSSVNEDMNSSQQESQLQSAPQQLQPEMQQPLLQTQPLQESATQPIIPMENAADGKVNVNQASADELTELPGIGPSKAKAIIQYREKYGPFQKIDDLLEVKGIGSKILDKMRSKITTGF